MRNSLPDDQEAIDQQASGWLVRIEENGLDRHAQADFAAWLAADPRHGHAYNEMRQTWADIPELNDLAGLVSLPDLPEEAVPIALSRRRWRTALVAGTGSVAAALIAIVAMPGYLFAPHSHYATDLAETRIVTLPDGSSVTLGAKSSITVRFTDGERRIVLAGGEAFFDVVHNPTRPFVVEAGNSLVRDIGTKFDVNLSDDTVRVSVLEGAVQVRRAVAATKETPQLLRAGQQAEMALLVTSAERGAPESIAPIVAQPAQAPGAWREGRMVFDNVRLADLAADVNRYYAPGVDLASTNVEDLRVTASFKTSEIPAFMRALSDTLPVQATQDGSGKFTVSSSSH
jgi:transmembrane sensor